MTLEFWLFYTLTVLAASIIPGPSMLLALMHGIKYGSRKTVATAMGNVTASVMQAVISIAGLGILLTASESIFLLVKWCGAAYLIHTGINILRSPAADFNPSGPGPADTNATWKKRFMQAFLVAVGNPKAVIFFTALFPQFIDASGAHLFQYIIMVGTLAVVAFCCFMIYAVGGGRISAFFSAQNAGKWIKRLIGGTFVGAGVSIACTDGR